MTGRRRQAGFTLLELLVAMTVLGVLTGLLASGLGFGSRVWERERNQLDMSAEMQLVQDVLRRMLAQAMPLSAPPDNSGTQEAAFVGHENAIEFLGPPPAQSLVGGIYAYRLAAEPGTGGTRLVLEWRIRPPQPSRVRTRVTNAEPAEQDKLQASHEVVLLDHLGGAEFAFFGPPEDGGKSTWRNDWQNATTLPQLVRVKVDFRQGDGRRWPELLVEPRIASLSND